MASLYSIEGIEMELKVKELIAQLSNLDPDLQVVCVIDGEDDDFDGHKKAYEILELKECVGHKERLHMSNFNAAFTEAQEGEAVCLLKLTHDF